MALKLISRNNVGVMATLVLVILLSQSRFFTFLTETPLGRIFLLGLTIIIACSNKIFGLLAVLFIIIAFNQNHSNVVQSYNFYEGFREGNVDLKDVVDDKVEESVKKGVSEAKGKVKKQANSVKVEKIDDSSDTTTTTSSSVSDSAREGFCMSDRELNILRGKQSNAVPVFNKSREQTNEVDPSDKSFFSSDYALF